MREMKIVSNAPLGRFNGREGQVLTFDKYIDKGKEGEIRKNKGKKEG